MTVPLQSRIHFHFQSGPFNFPARTEMKAFLISIFKKERKPLEDLGYVFCTDEFLLQLNNQFLDHDTLTDIITFEMSPKGEPIVGEIYISIERVRENARSFNKTFNNELSRVMIHGILHLCGYKDKSAKDKLVMRSKEEEYLRQLYVSRGT